MSSIRLSSFIAIILVSVCMVVNTTEARFLSVDPKSGDAGSSQSWNRYPYASNNPINRVDPDGEDDIEFGGRKFTIFTGDVFVLTQPSGGLHVVTYSHQGQNREIFVFDNTASRNSNPAHFGPRTLEIMFPEGTSSQHHLNDVTQETVQGRSNPNSPVNGAEAVGVVPASTTVTTGDLADAAGTIDMFYGDREAGNLQCTDFVLELAERAGYQLSVPENADTEDFREAVAVVREETE